MIRIKELREKKGINQKELGKLLNVAQNTISNWENGSREPDSKALVKLAEILDCSTDYLLGKSDDPHPPPPPHPDIKDAPLAFMGNTEGLDIDELEKIINRAVKKALEEKEREKKE